MVGNTLESQMSHVRTLQQATSEPLLFGTNAQKAVKPCTNQLLLCLCSTHLACELLAVDGTIETLLPLLYGLDKTHRDMQP
jgi:hypothetical protein